MSSLLEWVSEFIDYAGSHKKDLVSKDITNAGFICRHKDNREINYIVHEILSDSLLPKTLSGNTVLVCLNTKKNLQFTIKNWKKLIKNPKLKIFFVNPKINEKWVLIPYTHNFISDPDSLQLGLKSLFEGVEEVK